MYIYVRTNFFCIGVLMCSIYSSTPYVGFTSPDWGGCSWKDVGMVATW